MNCNRLFVLFVSILISYAGYSTHIVGGEIYYTCQGGNNYQVTLKVYRDCLNGAAPFDNPASIGVFDVNGNQVNTMFLALPGSQILVAPVDPCSPPPNACVEEAVYTGNINLPPLVGGYFLAYQRCCRNSTILNLVSPGNVGATYMTHIPDPALAACNSAPYFKNYPPIFLCAGKPIVFDHSATDPDNDSLAYELCDPYHGASVSNPMPAPVAPPYTFIPFGAGYSGSYPMSSLPALSIDPITGVLTGTPNMIGQWVVGVCVKEYRNGTLINTNKRDFQFNVTNCPQLTVSAAPTQQAFCSGLTINFTNNSQNATSYFWNFGDPSATNDTSNLVSPQWTYGAPDTYTIMLIANPGLSCADTSYSVFKIDPLLSPSFVPPPSQCIETNSFNLAAAGSYQGSPTSTFQWNFGPSATPSSSNSQNPTGVVFNAVGVYPVTLTVSENGCTENFTDIITVNPMATANFEMEPLVGCTPFTVQFVDTTNPAGSIVSYTWDFGDGNVSNLPSPSNTYNALGVYNVSVTLVATNIYGCDKSYDFDFPNSITINPIPHAEFSAHPLVTSIFEPEITFSDRSSNGITCSLWYGDGNVLNGCDFGTDAHTYTQNGMYQVSQVLINGLGCSDTFNITVEIKLEYRLFIPNAFTANGDGLNDIFLPKVIGVTDYKFKIFDRWGQLLFDTNNLNQGWNGTFKGDKCKEEVYVYRIDFVDVADLKDHTYIGKVVLLR